ncbi:hypothetical protein [Phenylobacterium sp.]|uniref:hypothetical protein n=1 Tax=Phenylobacterium sp. TaxID=1871053 RepID=UPI002F4042AD
MPRAYYPDDAAKPFARTKPIFASHEDAGRWALEGFKEMFADLPITARDRVR